MKKYLIFALALLAPTFALAEGFNRDLQFGMQNNSDVTKLQELLTDEGLYSGPISGNFFSLTLKAVKKFQTREGIKPAFGYFGPLTRTKANQLLSVQGISQTVTNESGISVSPAITPPKTTDDVVAKLNDQIALLIRQIEELQKQQATLQNIQTEQKTQSLILSGIESNTAPPDPNPIVVPPPPPPPPPVPTKLKVYPSYEESEGDSYIEAASGANCQSLHWEVGILDQYNEFMTGQEVTFTTPLGNLTKKITKNSVIWVTQSGPILKSVNHPGVAFRYTPASTSTMETITFTSGDLSVKRKINVLNQVEGIMEAGQAVHYDNKWMIPSSGEPFDPITKLCTGYGSRFPLE